jgi:VanZ family protein
MNIRRIRFLNVVFIAIMLSKGMWNFLWYIGAMHLSLEILNRQALYLQHKYKLYNTVFWGYSLVLLERLRTNHFDKTTEWVFNSAGHLFFGIIICIKLYIYTALFAKHYYAMRLQRGLAAFVIFNLIGLANEVFQNYLCSRSLPVFIPDSCKDLKMNMAGAIVFMMVVFYRLWLQKKTQLKAAN